MIPSAVPRGNPYANKASSNKLRSFSSAITQWHER
jgi:hypothetical protein